MNHPLIFIFYFSLFFLFSCTNPINRFALVSRHSIPNDSSYVQADVLKYYESCNDRLGQAEDAVDALFIDSGKNSYLPNGRWKVKWEGLNPIL